MASVVEFRKQLTKMEELAARVPKCAIDELARSTRQSFDDKRNKIEDECLQRLGKSEAQKVKICFSVGSSSSSLSVQQTCTPSPSPLHCDTRLPDGHAQL